MEQRLLVAVSQAATTHVEGSFQRHTSPDVDALRGSPAGGRWGPPGAYSVLYLGRPTQSVVVEAYRHLVDDDLDHELAGHMVGPRNLLTCEVAVSDLLDLRDPHSQQLVGLDLAALRSPIDEYAACQRVGQAAHQLDLHGVIAPAATALGETLALFEEKLPHDQQPRLTATERWEHLPADPRQLRLVDEREQRRGAGRRR